MKRIFILSTAAVAAVALIFSSCQPSRVWATNKREPRTYRESETYRYPEPGPRYYNSVSLIISPTPGFVMRQNPNGRYYHRSQEGFLYWKGYDDRFYLDRSYLRSVSYSRWEYDEWKRYSRQSH